MVVLEFVERFDIWSLIIFVLFWMVVGAIAVIFMSGANSDKDRELDDIDQEEYIRQYILKKKQKELIKQQLLENAKKRGK